MNLEALKVCCHHTHQTPCKGTERCCSMVPPNDGGGTGRRAKLPKSGHLRCLPNWVWPLYTIRQPPQVAPAIIFGTFSPLALPHHVCSLSLSLSSPPLTNFPPEDLLFLITLLLFIVLNVYSHVLYK